MLVGIVKKSGILWVELSRKPPRIDYNSKAHRMEGKRDSGQSGCFINLVGGLSFLGLFATGVTGLFGGLIRSNEPILAGAAYLLVGGLAFGALLVLVIRRSQN
ncbi:hypothetical protein VT84_16395 [Gemmata sp. SH-PL17]|nr:hypothetical protein VT84_16395 [Gemmata sp. SH-PL17]